MCLLNCNRKLVNDFNRNQLLETFCTLIIEKQKRTDFDSIFNMDRLQQ